jgi:hypothetical protein
MCVTIRVYIIVVIMYLSQKKSRLLSPAHTNGVQSYSSGRLEQAPNRYDQRALRWVLLAFAS